MKTLKISDFYCTSIFVCEYARGIALCLLFFLLVSCASQYAVPEIIEENSFRDPANTTINDITTPVTDVLPVSQSSSVDQLPRYMPTLFVYQLQNARYEKLFDMKADLLIVDPDDASFSHNKLEQLTEKKTVLAYLSIGEAEDYRDYWRSYWKRGDPEWLHAENPDWKGNYKVKYWFPEWQRIIEQYIAEIMIQGYSGLYLDVIDAYEYWEYQHEPNTRQLMIDFVKKIKLLVQEINPAALVFVQNGEELFSDDSYLKTIDGIGREDVWFDDDARVSEDETEKVLLYLDLARSANKSVLIIDYPSDKKKRCEVRAKAQEKSYLAYTPTRELDKVVIVNC